jgi:hypothetical protein
MMHAMSTPPDLRARLTAEIDQYARELVDFLLTSIATGARDHAE